MTINATEQLSAQRAEVHLGAVGSTAPVDSAEEPGLGFFSVGLTTPDSLSFSTEPEFEEINSHQSDYPSRRLQTGDSAAVSVDLMQWNADNLKAVFGGGTITELTPGTGEFKFVPPAMGERTELSAIITVIDGTKRYRWVFPRVQQVEGVESELQKGQGANLPLRLAVLGDDGGEAWYLLSNDPALGPVVP